MRCQSRQASGANGGCDFAHFRCKKPQIFTKRGKDKGSPRLWRSNGRKSQEKKVEWRVQEPVLKNFRKRRKKVWVFVGWWRRSVHGRRSGRCLVSVCIFHRYVMTTEIHHRSIKCQKRTRWVSTPLHSTSIDKPVKNETHSSHPKSRKGNNHVKNEFHFSHPKSQKGDKLVKNESHPSHLKSRKSDDIVANSCVEGNLRPCDVYNLNGVDLYVRKIKGVEYNLSESLGSLVGGRQKDSLVPDTLDVAAIEAGGPSII